MELTLKRKPSSNNCTLGTLDVGGLYTLQTLEDVERDDDNNGKLDAKEKVYGKTAINKGRYEVILNMSNRFKEYMPLLLKVDYFEGIRIHAGNTHHDTHGCILVGMEVSGSTLKHSRVAFNKLMQTLRSVERKEKIYITII